VSSAANSRLDNRYLEAMGPLRPLIEDDSLTEIMVNGPEMVYVERKGKILLTDIRFDDEAHLLRVIDTIVSSVGRRVDARTPLCDARLLDGSRVNAAIPPVALDGPLLTIRKFSKDPYQVSDLIGFGTITQEGASFIQACVMARANIVISGGTGPARPHCSTSARASSPSTNGSSRSRTPPSSSSTRSTSAGWSRVPRTSTARVGSTSANW